MCSEWTKCGEGRCFHVSFTTQSVDGVWVEQHFNGSSLILWRQMSCGLEACFLWLGSYGAKVLLYAVQAPFCVFLIGFFGYGKVGRERTRKPQWKRCESRVKDVSFTTIGWFTPLFMSVKAWGHYHGNSKVKSYVAKMKVYAAKVKVYVAKVKVYVAKVKVYAAKVR